MNTIKNARQTPGTIVYRSEIMFLYRNIPQVACACVSTPRLIQRHFPAGSYTQNVSFFGAINRQAGSHQYLQKAQNRVLLMFTDIQLILSDAIFGISLSDKNKLAAETHSHA